MSVRLPAKILFHRFATRVAAINIAHGAVRAQQVRAIDEQIERIQIPPPDSSSHKFFGIKSKISLPPEKHRVG